MVLASGALAATHLPPALAAEICCTTLSNTCHQCLAHGRMDSQVLLNNTEDPEACLPEHCSSARDKDKVMLDGFLLEALKIPKDRSFILRTEQIVERFVRSLGHATKEEPEHAFLEFPPMN